MGDDSSAAGYIRLVHRLIEECLLFNMSKEECMEILSERAKIQPIVTSTVWNELEKENKEFFQAYLRSKEVKVTQVETTSDQDVADTCNKEETTSHDLQDVADTCKNKSE